MRTTVKGTGKLGKLAITPAYVKPAKGAIVFLHGTCDTGPGLQRWVNDVLRREFNFYNHSILFPTAPSRPYELLNGQVACVWFNRLKLSPDVPEDLSSIENAASTVGKLVMDETTRQGIPLSKVVLGGFSQGGTLALHLAYRFYPEVAGCFALSSFLPSDSGVYDRLDNKLKEETGNEKKEGEGTVADGSTESQSQLSPQKNQKIPESPAAGIKCTLPTQTESRHERQQLQGPVGSSSYTKGIKREHQLPRLFMSNGTHDPLVLHSWAKATFCKLRDHQVDGHFYTVPNGEHRLHQQQLQILHGWIAGVLHDDNKGDGDFPSEKIPPRPPFNDNDRPRHPTV